MTAEQHATEKKNKAMERLAASEELADLDRNIALTKAGHEAYIANDSTLTNDAKRKAALLRMAAALGADVPFFLHPAPFCVGTGIGDRLKPVRIARSLPYLVLAYPGLRVSTAQAYKALPAAPRSAVLARLAQLDRLIRGLQRGRPVEEWEGLLFNRLEGAPLPVLAQVEQARQVLARLGVRGARMSGSGSSVFGFVASHGEGESVLRRLRGYPWQCFLTSCQG